MLTSFMEGPLRLTQKDTNQPSEISNPDPDLQIRTGRDEQPVEVPGVERRLLRTPKDQLAPKDRAEAEIGGW